MTYEKGSCAEFELVDVFQFKSDSVKPFSFMRIKLIIIIRRYFGGTLLDKASVHVGLSIWVAIQIQCSKNTSGYNNVCFYEKQNHFSYSRQ